MSRSDSGSEYFDDYDDDYLDGDELSDLSDVEGDLVDPVVKVNATVKELTLDEVSYDRNLNYPKVDHSSSRGDAGKKVLFDGEIGNKHLSRRNKNGELESSQSNRIRGRSRRLPRLPGDAESGEKFRGGAERGPKPGRDRDGYVDRPERATHYALHPPRVAARPAPVPIPRGQTAADTCLPAVASPRDARRLVDALVGDEEDGGPVDGKAGEDGAVRGVGNAGPEPGMDSRSRYRGRGAGGRRSSQTPGEFPGGGRGRGGRGPSGSQRARGDLAGADGEEAGGAPGRKGAGRTRGAGGGGRGGRGALAADGAAGAGADELAASGAAWYARPSGPRNPRSAPRGASRYSGRHAGLAAADPLSAEQPDWAAAHSATDYAYDAAGADGGGDWHLNTPLFVPRSTAASGATRGLSASMPSATGSTGASYDDGELTGYSLHLRASAREFVPSFALPPTAASP